MAGKHINTHGLKVDFGKHKGELWTRVPVGYLRWCVNELPKDRDTHRIAEAELARRGDTMPTTVNISNHAIDKASLRLLTAWQANRYDDEGLYSWLVRMCNEALKAEDGNRPKRITYNGCVLIFAYGNAYPTLKTVVV